MRSSQAGYAEQEEPRGLPRPGWDGLLLAILVSSHLRIVSAAEAAVLPTLRQDVLRHPFLGGLLPDQGIAAMGARSPWPGEPVGLLLVATTLGLTLLYLLTDLLCNGNWQRRLQWTLLASILITALFMPTTKLILLRHQSGPASYTHDGGVIQTEAAIDYLIQGRNPYVEDYLDTPMAEWGFDEYRTALYHYPYLPWTFLFSAPFYLVGEQIGFYDQRVVYLLLLAIALWLAPRLVTGMRRKRAVVMVLGLNPVMGLDVVFGQNDSFVLAWIVLSLVAWRSWQRSMRSRPGGDPSHLVLSTLLFGLACASKPTAWFLAPFYGLLLVAGSSSTLEWASLVRQILMIARRAAPAIGIFLVLLGPYLLWDPYALYDDVWRWSSGQGETGYQIWGWGASNFVLAMGWVEDRFAQWPFWLLEITVAIPILLWFLYRQLRVNRLGSACWHYALLLAVFFYVSRFFNENYLGYILGFLALGYLGDEAGASHDADADRP